MAFGENTVWDTNSGCDVLWIPRSGSYRSSAFETADLPTLAKRLLSNVDLPFGAQFLGLDDVNDVVSSSWNKDTSSPAGVFSLALKPRVDYLKLIQPHDLMFIFMDADKVFNGPRFTGTMMCVAIVDRVSESRSTDGGGATVSTIHVSGRDFGVILMDTATVIDPAFANIAQTLFDGAYLQRVGSQQNAASPLENVLNMLDLFFIQGASKSALTRSQWALGPESQAVPLISMLDVGTFMQSPLFGYDYPEAPALASAGNVWTLIEGMANRVVNEMFIDVRDYNESERGFLRHMSRVAKGHVGPEDATLQQATLDKVSASFVQSRGGAAQATKEGDQVLALVMRQLPYDADAFAHLPQSTVMETEIFEFDIGRAGHDVFNYFKLNVPDLNPTYQEISYGIWVNTSSVRRHGIRRLAPDTRYLFTTSKAANTAAEGSQQPGSFDPTYDFYIGLLACWYAYNEEFLSGSMTTRFRPDIRCGTRLVTTVTTLDGLTQVLEFYVQAVAHQYSVEQGSSRSTFTLIRGIESGGPANVNLCAWTASGPSIPPLAPGEPLFTRVNAAGQDTKTSTGQVIRNDALVKP